MEVVVIAFLQAKYVKLIYKSQVTYYSTQLAPLNTQPSKNWSHSL